MGEGGREGGRTRGRDLSSSRRRSSDQITRVWKGGGGEGAAHLFRPFRARIPGGVPVPRVRCVCLLLCWGRGCASVCVCVCLCVCVFLSLCVRVCVFALSLKQSTCP